MDIEFSLLSLDNINVNKVEYLKFISGNSSATLSHLLEWLGILRKTFRHQCFLLLGKKKHQLMLLLPVVLVKSKFFGRGLISMPYLNQGGFLTSDKNDIQPATKFLENYFAGKIDYLEIRSLEPYPGNFFDLKTHKVTFCLDLPDNPKTLFDSFSAKLKSQIRRPEKSGASSEIINGQEIRAVDIDKFYSVFSEHMRDLGTPVYPEEFFYNVLNELQKNCILVFIKLNEKITSAGFILTFKDTAEILWAASLKKYNKFSVNMLLYWKTLEYLSKQGFKTFDFGRCSKDSGTYNFKKQWNAECRQLYWHYRVYSGKIPDISPENKNFSLPIKIWQNLPLCVANRLGAMLSRHLP